MRRIRALRRAGRREGRVWSARDPPAARTPAVRSRTGPAGSLPNRASSLLVNRRHGWRSEVLAFARVVAEPGDIGAERIAAPQICTDEPVLTVIDQHSEAFAVGAERGDPPFGL